MASKSSKPDGCGICGGEFSALHNDTLPRLLQCGHFFCSSCLAKLVRNRLLGRRRTFDQKPKGGVIRCPYDRTITGPVQDVHLDLPLHSELVESLRAASQLDDDAVLVVPGGQHGSDDNQQDQGQEAGRGSKFCSEHAGQEVVAFDKECSCFVCEMCLATTSPVCHQHHARDSLDEMGRQWATQIESWLRLDRMATILRRTEAVKETRARAQVQCDQVKETIRRQCATLRDEIDKREMELCNQVDAAKKTQIFELLDQEKCLAILEGIEKQKRHAAERTLELLARTQSDNIANTTTTTTTSPGASVAVRCDAEALQSALVVCKQIGVVPSPSTEPQGSSEPGSDVDIVLDMDIADLLNRISNLGRVEQTNERGVGEEQESMEDEWHDHPHDDEVIDDVIELMCGLGRRSIDLVSARSELQKLVAAGNPIATALSGELKSSTYTTGSRDVESEEVMRLFDTALECGLEKEATRGDAIAQFLLGRVCHMEGKHEAAVEWYTKAAHQRCSPAQNYLGCMFQNGHGVSQDNTTAVKWYAEAAERNDAGGQNNLGWMYHNGLGVEEDYTRAIEWYTKAAGQNNAGGQNNLGWMYQNGLGVEAEPMERYSKAIEWYTKAAGQNNAGGQHNLGLMYRNGRGVDLGEIPVDYTKAVEWFTKAADQNDAASQYDLGEMWENGLGVDKDQNRAVDLYQKAAAQGNEDAKQRLKRGISKSFFSFFT